MNERLDQLRYHIVSVAFVIAILPVVWLAISTGMVGMLGVVGVVAVVVAVYIGFRHPLWLYWSFAVVLGIIPFGRIPGVPILPLYLPLLVGIVVAALVHPHLGRSLHPLEFAVLGLWFSSLVSFLVTTAIRGFPPADASMFIRWSLATFAVFALLQLPREHLATFGRIFVWLASFNGLWGLFMVFVDSNGKSLQILSPFGYTAENIAQFQFKAVSAEGVTKRLGGTWMEPNGAGGNLTLALLICVILFVGWRRVILATLLSVALALTLSRQMMFAVAVGVLLVAVFHPMSARARAMLLSGIGLAITAAFLTPSIQHRIMQTFNSDDPGRSARIDALYAFPGQMSGYWGFGHGWGIREFTDPAFAFNLNLPSNAILITLYRGGALPFLAFTILLVVGCVVGYRLLCSNSIAWALYGGIFIGVVVVAVNLDHGFADVVQGILRFSLFLVFLIYADLERIDSQLREQDLPRAEPSATGPPAPVGVN